ncbi:MAG: NUDIX hydrolase N-terminal domain-containing protein [Terrisporobacter sp.]|uniref:NUDIX hydrolase N-terminal domain-containing protein n=2 Tax=Terrisporobacter sp. TaxID=1965305 RepID=UPI003994540B
MNNNFLKEPWLKWAIEIQSIAQIGLTYTKDDKILLVHEKNGFWSLPGGWVDILESIESNTIKEVKEEAGLDKVFVECEVMGGEFVENIEIVEIGYFSLDNLPKLAEEKCTPKQVEMCFEAKNNKNWQVYFD